MPQFHLLDVLPPITIIGENLKMKFYTNLSKDICNIYKQDFKIVDLYFVKSE